MTSTTQPKPGAGAAPWVIPIGIGAGLCAVALLGATKTVQLVFFGLEALFVLFFVRHFTFTLAALRTARRDLDGLYVDPRYQPPVSVLVACKNEVAVIERLVPSLLGLDYPEHLLQLVVVDDGSTDGMSELLDELGADAPRLTVIHRRGGVPGKSAALNEALPVITGDVVIVFDADHSPHSDVVLRLVRHFADPTVGAVQGRCQVINGDDSPLARIIAVDYLAGYLVNEYGRQSLYNLPAYGGANCAVRTSALREFGGWNENSVTEDTDLTIRLMLSGRQVRYDVTAVDDEEGVVTLRRYWRQRYRWARGHQQCCRDYRRCVVGSDRLTFGQKLESLSFLYAFHVPVAAALGLLLLPLWFLGIVQPVLPQYTFLLWTVLFLGPMLELGAGLLLANAPRREAFGLIWFLPLLLVSTALSTKAWLDGLLERRYVWVKTERAGDVVAA